MKTNEKELSSHDNEKEIKTNTTRYNASNIITVETTFVDTRAMY